MNLSHALRFGSLVLCLGFAACSSANEGEERACVPGQAIQCAGPNGCLGAQSCNAEGSGYEACVCGGIADTVPHQNTGGSVGTNSAHPVGGSTMSQSHGTGGASSLGASGGNPGATGGSPAISTANCAPKSMAGYQYPGYVPARRLQHSCTLDAIKQYFDECYRGGECAAFEISGAQAQCGACLAPTELNATAYGPLLRVGSPNAYFYDTNVAGCEELLGETACAPKMQVEFLCGYLSCADSCPLNSGSGYYDALFRCMNDAKSSQCNQEHAAAICLTNAANVAACSGNSFEEQFIAIAKVFCL